MADRGRSDNSDRNAGLVVAFQNVTDGVFDLAKTHFELARAEARAELKEAGSETARAAVGVGFALVGFGILNLAVVCLAGVFAGLVGMSVTAGILGTLYTVIGVSTTRGAMERLKAKENALPHTKDEIRRSTEWVKEIRDNS